jgi:hypothetical protein
MPVKARIPKRRVDASAELAAWSMLFETGYDYFHDLADHGFANEKAALKAARAAWARLCPAFLAAWQPTRVRELPWALEQFGRPSCR